MIFDFPTIKHETVDVEIAPGYTHRITKIVRGFWFRIIWMESQKTILFGRHRINFTSEPDSELHTDQVAESKQDWWER